MKVESLKLKVRSCLKKLFTVHGSRFTERGFTLIEIIMIIVIVSIAIPSLLIMVGQEAKFGVESELRVTAANVGQALMEEIKTKKWDQNSPIPPGTASTTLGPESATYDDVDDYNDLVPASLGTTPCTDTFTVSGIAFTRAVDVCYVSSGALNTCVDTAPVAGSCNRTIAAGSQTDYKKITVTVTAPATNWGSDVVLTTVMTNY